MSHLPLDPEKTKAAGVGTEAASENNQQHDYKAPTGQAASIVSNVLHSKSTATEVQLKKVIALLRQGPKTTMELREHGIMMPAARVFQLKNERQHIIQSELIPLFDAYGYRHSKCARYHLIEDARAGVQA
jgi:hypothetical protein